MRAKNHKEIVNSYLKFAVFLVVTVFITVLSMFFFFRTADAEYMNIALKTREYDAIRSVQLDAVTKVDSLIDQLSLLGSNKNLNEGLLLDVVSRKKLSLQKFLENTEDENIRLHLMMVLQLSDFLRVKDSIRSVSTELRMVKEDLIRCIESNKNATVYNTEIE
ncbi:type VI secretion system TssO [Marinilabilia salmonicolor]|uniref:type VI secretion system TssO n=1 Tax=Marinilabilia salmonicolor TaxID=989 RepID=UPI000299F2D7|nr:type VI secretion system TssO [Marinilabilia salmonicolor]